MLGNRFEVLRECVGYSLRIDPVLNFCTVPVISTTVLCVVRTTEPQAAAVMCS